MREFFAKSSCLGCVIRLAVFKREVPLDVDNSIYISTLSDHVHLYRNSWRGRLRFAWRALKGDMPEDICLEMTEDVEEFKKTFDEAYDYLKMSKNG